MLKRFCLISIAGIILSSTNITFAETQPNTLKLGVSVTEKVPADLMGTWRVVSNLEETNYPATFKKNNIDIWNLSRTGDVINLRNPFTGASAYVRVEYVKDNTIRFTKEGNYDSQTLTDTVEITLSGNKFTGKNYLSLKSMGGSYGKL